MSALVGCLRAGRGKVQYAADFIRAAGITNPTQRQALGQLEKGLLAAGLLDPYDRQASLIKTLYPLVGGSSATHSVNFVNPKTYSVTWYGSPGHSANGVIFNGIDQYADTNMLATAIDIHDSHLAYYADQAVADENRGGQGVAGRASSQDRDFLLSYNRGNLALYVSANDNALVAYSQPATLDGLLLGTRTSGTDARLYHKGNQVGASTGLDYSVMPNENILFGAAQNVTTSRVPCSFFSTGAGLNSTQQLAYYQIIQTFQLALGRAR